SYHVCLQNPPDEGNLLPTGFMGVWSCSWCRAERREGRMANPWRGDWNQCGTVLELVPLLGKHRDV
ncbi:unnamed protein product, partial [Bubo scandiacus]